MTTKMNEASNVGAGAARSPRELIEIYWDEIWNKRRVELIREICADPIIRHDAGSTTALSHEEQMSRVRQQVGALCPHFTHEVLNYDDRHVTSVWNMTSTTDSNIRICGIETFRAEDGRFTDCWNAPYAKGHWGRVGDPSVAKDLPPPEMLSSVEDIDHTWLQRVFRAAGLEVPRIAMVSNITPVGNGTSSNLVRVTFGYNADASGLPTSVIAKFPAIPMANLAGVEHLVGYTREARAYDFFGANPAFRIPRSYFAQSSPDGHSILILEDLGASGCRPGDQIGGCSPEDATLVVRELARLHARYWKDPITTALDWPLSHRDHSKSTELLYVAGAANVREHLADRVGSEVIDTMTALQPLVEPWLAANPDFSTLIHGEPRVDNVLFEITAEGPRACLIDLQMISFGDPLYDVAYFLSGSLEPDDRRACEARLVQEHSAMLQQADPSYDAASAWRRYGENLVAGLIITTVAASSVLRSEHGKQLIRTLARRNVAAIVDHGGLDIALERIRRSAAAWSS